MDFVGEIVEHEVEPPTEPTPFDASNGFPDPHKVKKVSRWKLKQQPKEKEVIASTLPPSHDESTTESLTEAEKIDKENREKMAKMSESEILQERQELLNQLDPKIVQGLLNRKTKNKQEGNQKKEQDTHSHDHDHHHEHAEGYNGWIGGFKTPKGVTDLSQLEKEEVDKILGLESERKVRFDDDKVERIEYHESADKADGNVIEKDLDSDAIAPEGYQLNQDDDEDMHENNGSTVHFTKPNQDDLDLDDPDFFDKLHEKYFPDLPKETEKLSWMTKPMPKQVSTTYESISDMRFDFNGNLVQINIDEEKSDSQQGIPTYLGLHHHSDNPHMAGYTLSELVHLSRSVVPGQRCISIQTLGRILHKLGKHELGIIPISDESDTNQDVKEMVEMFEKMMWDLIDELRIVESITEAADEKYTKNLSVRNYAIEALYLIKTAKGGQKE